MPDNAGTRGEPGTSEGPGVGPQDPAPEPRRAGRIAALGAPSGWLGRGSAEPGSDRAGPSGAPASSDASPIGMADLQRLEHLAWLVDAQAEEEEAFVKAKLALLARATPEGLTGPVPNLPLPTDELSSLERLRASGHLTDPEYEVLERRVLLRI